MGHMTIDNRLKPGCQPPLVDQMRQPLIADAREEIVERFRLHEFGRRGSHVVAEDPDVGKSCVREYLHSANDGREAESLLYGTSSTSGK